MANKTIYEFLKNTYFLNYLQICNTYRRGRRRRRRLYGQYICYAVKAWAENECMYVCVCIETIKNLMSYPNISLPYGTNQSINQSINQSMTGTAVRTLSDISIDLRFLRA